MSKTANKTKNKKQAKLAAVSWTQNAWNDYLYWHEQNLKIVNEINGLICECIKDPFTGTGKPEPLSENLTGLWSRRINHEHRLVYLPEDGVIYVLSCRFHY